METSRNKFASRRAARRQKRVEKKQKKSLHQQKRSIMKISSPETRNQRDCSSSSPSLQDLGEKAERKERKTVKKDHFGGQEPQKVPHHANFEGKILNKSSRNDEGNVLKSLTKSQQNGETRREKLLHSSVLPDESKASSHQQLKPAIRSISRKSGKDRMSEYFDETEDSLDLNEIATKLGMSDQKRRKKEEDILRDDLGEDLAGLLDEILQESSDSKKAGSSKSAFLNGKSTKNRVKMHENEGFEAEYEAESDDSSANSTDEADEGSIHEEGEVGASEEEEEEDNEDEGDEDEGDDEAEQEEEEEEEDDDDDDDDKDEEFVSSEEAEEAEEAEEEEDDDDDDDDEDDKDEEFVSSKEAEEAEEAEEEEEEEGSSLHNSHRDAGSYSLHRSKGRQHEDTTDSPSEADEEPSQPSRSLKKASKGKDITKKGYIHTLRASSPGSHSESKVLALYRPPHLREESTKSSESSNIKRIKSLVARFKQKLIGPSNRLSEANLSFVFAQFSDIFKETYSQMPRSETVEGQSEESSSYDLPAMMREAYIQRMNASCIENRFSTKSLIGIHIAMTKALSAVYDLKLMFDCLKFFALKLKEGIRLDAEKNSQKEAKIRQKRSTGNMKEEENETLKPSTDASLTCRNCLTAICLMFDFGMIGANLMIGLVHFSASEITEFSVNLLVFILRLAGARFKRDFPSEFHEIVKFLTALFDDFGKKGLQSEEAENVVKTTHIRFLLKDLDDLKKSRLKFNVTEQLQFVRNWISSSHNSQFLMGYNRQMDFSWDEITSYPTKEGSRTTHTHSFNGKASDSDNKKKMKEDISSSSITKRAALEEHKWLNTHFLDKKQWLFPQPGSHTQTSVLDVATKLRMTSGLQKSVFVALMDAVDDTHAIQRISSVIESSKQFPTVAAVIVHACLHERPYNLFYLRVILNFCRLPPTYSKKYCRCFKQTIASQLSIAESLGKHKAKNLATLIANLVSVDSGAVDVSILRFLRMKFINSSEELNEQNSTFSFVHTILSSLILEIAKLEKVEVEKSIRRWFAPLERVEDIKEYFLAVLEVSYIRKQSSSKEDEHEENSSKVVALLKDFLLDL